VTNLKRCPPSSFSDTYGVIVTKIVATSAEYIVAMLNVAQSYIFFFGPLIVLRRLVVSVDRDVHNYNDITANKIQFHKKTRNLTTNLF